MVVIITPTLENLENVKFRKFFAVPLILTGFLLISGCIELTGNWKANDGSMFTFNEDGTFEMKTYEYVSIPSSVWPNGEPPISESSGTVPNSGSWRVKQQGRYEVDWDKDPAWIDFIGTYNGQVFRAEGIIKKVNKNEIHINIASSGDNRPVIFENSHTYILTRVST